jgi:hypothetical protein
MVAAQIHDAGDRPEPRQHVGYRPVRTERVRWMKCARSNHKEEQMLAYMNDASNPQNAYPAFWAPAEIVAEGAAQ